MTIEETKGLVAVEMTDQVNQQKKNFSPTKLVHVLSSFNTFHFKGWTVGQLSDINHRFMMCNVNPVLPIHTWKSMRVSQPYAIYTSLSLPMPWV